MRESGYEAGRVELAVVGMAASFACAVRLPDYWHGVVNGTPAGRGAAGDDGAAGDGGAPGGAQPAALQPSPAALTLRLLEAACEDAGCAPRPGLTAAPEEPAAPTEKELESPASHLAGRFGFESARLLVETADSAASLADLRAHAEELRDGRRDALLVACVGEGGGAALVFKRLADAERDGQRIYALLKDISVFARDGAGGGADGPSTFGAAPDFKRGESAGLFGAALCDSTVSAEEAFRLLARAGAPTRAPLPRTAFDCTDARRGPAVALGLVKAALALHDKVLPASGLAPGAAPPAEATTLYVSQSARPWIQGEGRGPRRAGLYEFRRGGPSARALLEEYAGPAAAEPKLVNGRRPTELLCFSGETHAELLALVAGVRAAVAARPETPLAHLAYTLSMRAAGRHRLAVLAGDAADLSAKLAAAEERLSRQERARWQLRNGTYYARTQAGEPPARVAFMFPGFGSYYPWMLADLCLQFPPVRSWFDTLDGTFEEADGPLPSQLLFPPRTGARAPAEVRLHDVRGGAQGGFTATLALHELLRNLGVRCDVMLGHSNGENAALFASGTMRIGSRRELFDLLRRVTAREDEEAGAAPKGVFLGVSVREPDFIPRMLGASGARLHLAMDNCPHQVVLFGDEAAAEDAARQIKAAGGIALPMPFDRAYHTPAYEAQAERLRPIYDTIEFGPGHTRVYSCATARPFPERPDEIRALALRQWSSPVRFRETLRQLYAEGVRTFVEVGPNSMLTGFVTDTLRDDEHLAAAINTQRLSGLEQLQRLLAQLYVGGMDLNLEYLFRFRHVARVTLDAAGTAGQPAPEASPEASPGAAPEPAPPSTAREADGARTVRASTGRPKNGDHPGGRARGFDAPAGVAVAAADAAPLQAAHARPAAAAPATHADARAAILDGHFELMRLFLSSQSRVLASLFPGAAGAHAPARPPTPAHVAQGLDAPRAWPLLGEVVEHDGRRLRCRRRFDLRSDPFLLDHTLGRREPGRHERFPPLPVLPFTVSMEMLAEAASRLLGGRGVVVGLRDVRGHRWLALERDELVLDAVAEAQPPRSDEAAEVRVQLFEVGPGGRRQLSFEGLVRLARQYAPPPAPRLPPPAGPLPAAVSAEDFYRDFAFHGPCFRGIKHLRAWDGQALEAETEVPGADNFFGAAPAPALLTPAALLDSTGQLVGLWLIEGGERECAVFPFHAASFEQYAAPPAAGSRLLCRAALRRRGRTTAEADFEFVGEEGRVVARLGGLRLKISAGRHVPKILKPKTADSYFSDPCPQAGPGLACRRLDAATLGLLENDGGVWERALARQTLNARERECWSGLPEEGAVRAEWLAGRVAAKDAARQWAAQRLGLRPAPEEIEIEADGAGRLSARCPAWESRGAAPHVSISRSGGDVVAVAADAPAA